ncbi:uncharacterized protein LOC115621075 isoform X2 [Scaptodrosophila lebanonensis]|uniref:Uncharacterized protein LOC115621075 isoform X2 n=1 Tax=Drosophila lebanonensis TaxID=7225 RepID=A0A6J2T5B2_DROLE|nr:uncharacterized protein LOC115621075 isoform X2 [Scaptodrosophila lebanonensis]
MDPAENENSVNVENTPVAKKTRRAARLASEKKDKALVPIENIVSPKTAPVAAPKTPSSSMKFVPETPRRSARKSVRPPLDYDEIIEKNARSASKNIQEANNGDEQCSQKWTASEVGRPSRKRSRKSKRTANSNVIERSEEAHDEARSTGEAVTCVQKETIEMHSTSTDAITLPQKETSEGELTNGEVVIFTHEDRTEEFAIVEATGMRPDVECSIAEATTVSSDHTLEVKTTPMGQKENNGGLHPDEMEELGLSPIEQDDEMPSLILLDDGELCSSVEEMKVLLEKPIKAENTLQLMECSKVEEALNTTFDADKQDDMEVVPQMVVSPEKKLKVKNSIKVVLTDIEDHSSTILNLDDSTDPRTGAVARCGLSRFPTPYKSKPLSKNVGNRNTPKIREKNSSFNINCLDVADPIKRRRSKSISELKTTKAVSFYSPIEIVHIDDIDERWKPVQDNHVTKRRKRSISLDERRLRPSRIPKPTSFEIKKDKTNTVSKPKTRGKLPNFAAIHKKQSEKMENLVQYIERKAERAKVLTNSASKLHLSSTGSEKKGAKVLATDSSILQHQRPCAMKKIDLTNVQQTPIKLMEQERQRLMILPKPSQTACNALKSTNISNALGPKPAFNLSTSLVKSFSAVPNKNNTQENPVQDKVLDRQERHKQMYKGGRVKENKADFIRGVRLNRRFELQMQHRRQLDEN